MLKFENSFWLSLYSSNILIESSSTSQYRICLYMEAIIIIIIILEAGVLCVFVNSLVAN